MTCKGLCSRYPKGRRSGQRGQLIGNGTVYCVLCVRYFQWDGLYCPCCHYRVRLKAKRGESRRKRLEVR